MGQCITANPTSLDASTLNEDFDFLYTVRITSSVPTIRVNFTPPRNESAAGTVTGVSVSPSGPSHGTDWIEFTSSHLGTLYVVQVSYTNPPAADQTPGRLETPTKTPKFKPQSTCPTS